MDKGIRPAVNAKFNELLQKRSELGNTGFRKTVMAYAMEEFGITLASAATHYNHAFKTVKLANPELVADLGRADDKKGGRKPKAKEAAKTETAAVQAVAGEIAKEVAEDKTTADAAAQLAGEAAPAADAANEVAPVTTYSVKRVKDGVVVAEKLTEAEANALIAKAVAAKKAKLVLA